MPRSSATLEQILGLLPRVDELEGLRLSIVRAARLDPSTEWDSARDFATIDKRVLDDAGISAALQEAEAELQRYVASLFASVQALVRAYLEGRDSDAVQQLIELGERQEGQGLHAPARRYFECALALALPLPAKEPQILALRRIARVARSSGDYAEALIYYGRSAELARDAGDRRGEVIACTGTGYVLALQGRWEAAERTLRGALERSEGGDAPEGLALERAQLVNNLAILGVRQHRLEEAEAWLAQARTLWASLSSPVDTAVCLHCEAQLRQAQDRQEESRELYRAALEQDLPDAVRAGIAIDLAEACAQAGDLKSAEGWARVAEEHAITSRSPYILGRVYQGRGNIARAAGADDGFIFFEKALQIAREKDLPLLEAEALSDYALQRHEMGGREEAASYLARAREIFAGSGAEHELRKVERLRERLSWPRAETVVD